MKSFNFLATFIFSVSSFANCKVLIHKTVSRKTLDHFITYTMTNKILEKTTLSAFEKNPNFGIKESSKMVSTGKKDIFNEDITETIATLSIYENGSEIFTTSESKDFSLLVKELAQKLIDLKCE